MTKKTRILNISPKAQLAITDNTAGAYPTILRTGDERTLGDNLSQFNESDIQVFSKQNVLMPFNVSKDRAEQSGFLTGTIILSKTPDPSSQYLTQYKEESYIAFNESRNPAGFFTSGSKKNNGFDEKLYQGFTSPISSKIAIPIDISLSSNVDVKIVGNPGGGVTSSPFVYYNFDNKTWDQIGVTDPATGASTNYIHFIDGVLYTSGPNTWISASNGTGNGVDKIVKQFTSSPGIAASLTTGIPLNQKLFLAGYDKIGYPTSFFEAPVAKKYHAKTSQTLKLSNYITSPFVLEKIQVKIPVKSERYQNSVITGNSKGAGRDIDNYVFFLYRQNRSTSPVDSSMDVSSSVRSLVGNESFCFYNSKSMPLISMGNNLKPVHENQLEIDYGVSLTAVGTFTSKTCLLDMTFTPRTYEQQFTAPSAIGLRVGLGNTFTTGYIQNYWDGGQKNVKNYTTDLRSFPTLPRAIRTIHARGNNQFTYTTGSGLNTPDSTRNLDPRTLRSSTYSTSVRDPLDKINYFDEAVTSKSLNYRENLYVLLPEDELVFGIDAGHFPTYTPDPSVTTSGTPPDLPTGYLDTVASIGEVGAAGFDTISKLTLLAGEAEIILYGSLVKDGVELLGSLNQHLISPAIHEDVHQVISDQFQVNETSLYAGTYIGNYVTGSMSTTSATRGLVSELSGTITRAAELVNFPFSSSNNATSGSMLGSRTTLKLISSKFRYDRFGQFRDMLEQRIDTKGVETRYTARSLPLPNFVKTFGVTQIASPVVVSFVSQSTTTSVDPSSTRSGNLSFECTSSFPYYEDGTISNRSPIVFGENPPFEVQTVILDKASSLLSTT